MLGSRIARYAIVGAIGMTAPLSAALRAQAPVVTAAGDPSVKNDTIYALAVDPKAVPKEYKDPAYIYLLDDGVARYEADGRSSRTFRQVVEVLKQGAVAGWSERRFSYNPERQTLRINWMRVLRRSGEVVSDKASMSQESDVSASTDVPMYAAQKVRRYSLSGVAEGTIVDISYTLEEKQPYLAGDFYEGWTVSMAIPARRSRFLVDMPASVTPRITERHLDFARTVTEKNGRRVYLWARREVLPAKDEVFAPDSSVRVMSIALASPLGWGDIARWYEGLARDRYALGAVATAKVDSVVKRARTRNDTLVALHRWISHDLRYVAIELGVGGFQPRFPDSTVATGFGDCKDKATLFVAAAKHLGITAYPVLLNSTTAPEHDLPAVEQFNHAIAAIPQAGTPSGYLFTDLTTEAIPPTAVPVAYRGNFFLVVLPGGKSAEVMIPKATRDNLDDTRIAGDLSSDGKVKGVFTSTLRGDAAYGLAAMTKAVAPDSEARAAMTRMLATSLFRQAKGDSLMLPDSLRDASDTTPVTLRIVFKDGEGGKKAGPVTLLSIPAGFQGLPTRFASVIEALESPENEDAHAPRELPIDAAEVFGASRMQMEIRLQLPVGWKAQLPKNVTAESAFGSYASDYSQSGRTLVARVMVHGTTVLRPKEEWPALLAWMKAVAADKLDYIVLDAPKP